MQTLEPRKQHNEAPVEELTARRATESGSQMKARIFGAMLFLFSAPSLAANWNYDSGRDEMRNATWRTARSDSPDELHFGFPYNNGSNTASLHVANRPDTGKQIYLVVDKGQFNCGYDGCRVSLKFDDGPIKTVIATPAAGGDSNVVFLPYQLTLGQLRKAKRLIIEAWFYSQGQRQMHFTVDGLDWK